MARVFVHYDRSGKILSLASVETMPEKLDHPFHVTDPADGVLEIGAGDPALANGLEHIHENMKVDVAKGRLVKKRGARPK